MTTKIPTNLQKAKIKFSDYSDWQELTINGETFYEGHRVEARDWIDFIQRAFGVVIEFEYINTDESES